MKKLSASNLLVGAQVIAAKSEPNATRDFTTITPSHGWNFSALSLARFRSRRNGKNFKEVRARGAIFRVFRLTSKERGGLV